MRGYTNFLKILIGLGLAGVIGACATQQIQRLTRVATETLRSCGLESALAGAAETEGLPKIQIEEPLKILQVPRIENASDKRRCSIEQMTIAVVDKGAFRNVYGTNAGYPTKVETIEARAAINPVMQYLDKRARTHLETHTKVADGIDTDNADKDTLKPLRILIYAHGGMVAHEGALASAEALAPMMMRDGYTPLFLVWNSDFQPTYLTGACCVNKGGAALVAPTYFTVTRIFSDLLGGISEMPETFANQFIRWDRSVRKKSKTEYYLNPTRLHRACNLLKNTGELTRWEMRTCLKKRVVFPFALENYEDKFGHLDSQQDVPITLNNFDFLKTTRAGVNFDHILNDQVYHFGRKEIVYGTLFPVRTTLSALGPEVGMRAWNNMVRRTRLAFEPEFAGEEYADILKDLDSTDTENKREAHGGFGLFFKTLHNKLEQGGIEVDGTIVPVELHFYGHSMGAIVGNELLWRYPDMPWKKVVYMGGAASIREFRMTALPVIRDKKLQFHNLSLHPIAESRELNFRGVPPQGSLLEWVDELFAGPRSVGERTIGKWINVELALPALLRGERDELLHFKVFPKQLSLLEKSRLDDSKRRAEAERMSYAYHEKYCDKFQAARKDLARRRVDAHGEPVRKNRRCYPITHGGFNHYSFWREAYLTTLPSKAPPDPELSNGAPSDKASLAKEYTEKERGR